LNFEYFILEGKVRIGEKDIQRAKALIKMSEGDLKLVNKLENFPSIAFRTIYEALRQILEAMCLVNGYKVYSHEAYTYYLKSLGEENIAEKFERYRKLRNGINYYGKDVPKEVAINAKKDIEQICKRLKEKYFEWLH